MSGANDKPINGGKAFSTPYTAAKARWEKVKRGSKVFLIEDDPVSLRWMDQILIDAGYQCLRYSGIEDFLSERNASEPGCAVVDFFLGDGIASSIQAELNLRGDPLPLIMISGGSDIPIAVISMQLGARNFLEKPFTAEQLLDNVRRALEEDARHRAKALHKQELAKSFAGLNEREQTVLRLLLKGEANKVIACDLDLGERTIELYRSRIMAKLNVRSIAELVRLAVEAGVAGEKNEAA